MCCFLRLKAERCDVNSETDFFLSSLSLVFFFQNHFVYNRLNELVFFFTFAFASDFFFFVQKYFAAAGAVTTAAGPKLRKAFTRMSQVTIARI